MSNRREKQEKNREKEKKYFHDRNGTTVSLLNIILKENERYTTDTKFQILNY